MGAMRALGGSGGNDGGDKDDEEDSLARAQPFVPNVHRPITPADAAPIRRPLIPQMFSLVDEEDREQLRNERQTRSSGRAGQAPHVRSGRAGGTSEARGSRDIVPTGQRQFSPVRDTAAGSHRGFGVLGD